MPDLSVIITAYNARPTISDCLRSLENQINFQDFEVIVIDSSTDDTAESVRHHFPWVRLFHFNTRLYCGSARNIGIREAKADIIAFIDADCIADPGWASAIIRSHQKDYAAVGGPIGNADPSSLTSTAAYFGEFSQWMPGNLPGFKKDIAGANMSYKKWVFEEFGDFIEGTYSSDTVFHWRLKRAGIRLFFDPGILIYHQYTRNFSSLLRHEIEHGRSFAEVRMRYGSFGPWTRLLYCVGCFPLFLKMACLIFLRNVLNPVYLSSFLKVWPLMLFVNGAWVLGEVMGYQNGVE